MTKDELIELINHTVYENEDGDITGEVMNLVLNAIVATIGVEANPDDEATGTLNKIKIGEEVFDVEGGGGTVDPYPTEGSTNPVQSGGVYDALITLIPRSSLFGGFITDAETPNPEDSRIYFLTLLYGDLPNFEIYDLPDNGKWKFIHWNPRDAAWDWETIDSYTSAKIDQLLSAVAAAISGKQDTISDLATIRTGAAAGATAYQKPSTGIPSTDLASGVQTSLGKADTAVQQVTVGTTTTGNAGTNASVTNSGTSTAPVLDFTIPRGADGADGADAVNPFKGWYTSAALLPANPVVGDYAYVKGATSSDPAAIYECTTAGTWSDSGRTADTSNVQTFATGEEVNLTGITSHISIASKKLIESGAIYSAFNTLVQLLRKVAYVEDDAKDILDVLESLIIGLDIPITGITIVGDASVVGSAVYVATLEPADTTERDIIWSITSGSEYATVLPNGTLVALNNGNIVLKCESAINSSVYDTKTIAVTDSATHIMPLTSDTDDTVGSLTPAKSAYTAISSDGMQITSNSNQGLSYAYSADFKTFIFDLKYQKSSTIWQYFFGNWGGGSVSNTGFAIKQNTNEVWYTTDIGDFSANKTLSENTWHRIGIQILSGTSAALWIDGEKIITPTFTSRTITHYIFGNNWRFQAVNGTRAIGGFLKNLKIYDQILSDDLMTVKTQIS